MELIIQPATDSEWPAILAIANRVAPDNKASNLEWWRNRQNFDASRYTRRHFIAHRSTETTPLAYAALEEGPDRSQYRLFFLIEPELLPTFGEQLYTYLELELIHLKAEKVWAWEEETDPLVSFLLEHSFEERSHLTLPDGRNSLFLARELLLVRPD